MHGEEGNPISARGGGGLGKVALRVWFGGGGGCRAPDGRKTRLCTTGQKVQQLHWLPWLAVYKVTVKEQIQYPDRLAGKQAHRQVGAWAGTHLESQT